MYNGSMNIVYLFVAGASANALPTISNKQGRSQITTPNGLISWPIRLYQGGKKRPNFIAL
jgi:hypothetical protein